MREKPDKQEKLDPLSSDDQQSEKLLLLKWFPVEILAIIFSFLRSSADFTAFSLTCKLSQQLIPPFMFGKFNFSDESSNQLIHFLTRTGKIQSLEALKLTPGDIIQHDLIHLAIEHKQQAVLDCFYQKIIVPYYKQRKRIVPNYEGQEQQDVDRNTLAHWAAMLKQIDALKKLLNDDPTILNQENCYGFTPTIFAHANGLSDYETLTPPQIEQVTLTRLIIDYKITSDKAGYLRVALQLTKPKEEEKSNLLCAAAHTGLLLCVQLLLENGVNLNQPDEGGNLALHSAAAGTTDCWRRYDSLACAKLLLENRADPNQKDERGNTATYYATFKGDTDTLLLLFQNGAYFDLEQKFDGRNLLELVENRYQPDCASLFVCQLMIFSAIQRYKPQKQIETSCWLFPNGPQIRLTRELKEAKATNKEMFDEAIQDILNNPNKYAHTSKAQRDALSRAYNALSNNNDNSPSLPQSRVRRR